MKSFRLRKCLHLTSFFLVVVLMLNFICFNFLQRNYEHIIEENKKGQSSENQQIGKNNKIKTHSPRHQSSSDLNSSIYDEEFLTRMGTLNVTECLAQSSGGESILVEDRAHKLSKLKKSNSGILRSERKGNPIKFGLPPKKMTQLLNAIVDWFTTRKNSPKDDLLNNHNFHYWINSNICTSYNVSVVIIVSSAVVNFRKRTRIRETWGGPRQGAVKPTTIFLLGTHISKIYQKKIEKESQSYGDIVQGNFIDSYKNLTYKHIMALHWATLYCHRVTTLVKIDDDVFVDVYKLVNFSETFGSFRNKIYCSVLRNVFPKGFGKWALTVNEYPFAFFPSYCEGMAYIIAMDVARKLVRASDNMAFFWIDDVFVTGILARKASIAHKAFLEGHKAIKRNSVIKGGIESVNLSKHMFFTEFTDWDFFMKNL